MSKWSRSDVIGLLSLILAMGSFSVALVVVPEFRQLLGLDRSSASSPSGQQSPPPAASILSPPAPSIAPSPSIATSPNVSVPVLQIRPRVMTTATARPTVMPTAPLETHFRKQFPSAPASWCQSVKDGRQFCEANNICIESKETYLLRLKENGCQ